MISPRLRYIPTLLLTLCIPWVSDCAAKESRPEPAVIHLNQEPSTLNPYADPIPGTLTVCSVIFDTLVDISDKWEIQPELALKLPIPGSGISKDGLTYKFNLRQKVKWHDDIILTSEDVGFTIERYVLPRAKSGSVALKGFERIQGVDCPETNQVLFHLKEPWPGFLEALANVPILPKHLLEKQVDPNTGGFWRNPVGTGPFAFGDWRTGALRLTAWDEYFKGKPKLPGITFRTLQDEKDALSRLEKGDIHVVSGISIRAGKQIKGTKGLKAEGVSTPFAEYAVFNTQGPILIDKRVRKAIAALFDFNTLKEDVYGGFWRQAAALGLNPTRAGRVSFDPDKARKLLDDAGWRVGVDGIRQKSGRKLTLDFAITSGNKQREQVVSLVREEAKRVGISVNVKPYPASLFFGEASDGGIVDGGRFDIALFGIATGMEPDPFKLIHSSMVPPDGGNCGYYKNTRVDWIIEALRKETDPKVRVGYQSELGDILSDEMPYIPLFHWARIDAYTVRLRNVKTAGTPGGLVWNAWEWSLAPWKDQKDLDQ